MSPLAQEGTHKRNHEANNIRWEQDSFESELENASTNEYQCMTNLYQQGPMGKEGLTVPHHISTPNNNVIELLSTIAPTGLSPPPADSTGTVTSLEHAPTGLNCYAIENQGCCLHMGAHSAGVAPTGHASGNESEATVDNVAESVDSSSEPLDIESRNMSEDSQQYH